MIGTRAHRFCDAPHETPRNPARRAPRDPARAERAVAGREPSSRARRPSRRFAARLAAHLATPLAARLAAGLATRLTARRGVDELRRSARVVLVAAAAALFAGCGLNEAKEGNLGKGAFVYDCLSQDDVACPDLTPKPFPAEIAVGARFKVSFQCQGITSASDPCNRVASVAPVSPALLDNAGDAFRAKRPGYAGIVAVAADGSVVDEAAVKIAAIAKLRLTDDTGQGLSSPVLAPPGAQIVVHCTGLGALDEPLAGLLACAATSDAPAVVGVGDASGNHVTLLALAKGSAHVTITSGDASVPLTVTVN